ncbi:MAG: hypothetical protein LBL35_05470 [Clostridiales bacterium]|nr:hypothetical protein [Clostridiales bacterium]
MHARRTHGEECADESQECHLRIGGGDYCEKAAPRGVPVELADCLIRILDICAAYDIDIESVISVKMKYNAMREYRHGGKRC